jgi:hypothetical protein
MAGMDSARIHPMTSCGVSAVDEQSDLVVSHESRVIRANTWLFELIETLASGRHVIYESNACMAFFRDSGNRINLLMLTFVLLYLLYGVVAIV